MSFTFLYLLKWFCKVVLPVESTRTIARAKQKVLVAMKKAIIYNLLNGFARFLGNKFSHVSVATTFVL